MMNITWSGSGSRMTTGSLLDDSLLDFSTVGVLFCWFLDRSLSRSLL